MRFIKENSYDIVKFMIYQFGIAIFALAVAIPLNDVVRDEFSRKLVQLGVSALAVIFYFILVYVVSWEYGATDRIRIDSGKIKGDPIKCMKIALLANVPNFVLSALAIASSLFYADGNAWTGILLAVTTILALIESMYLGAVEFIAYGIDNTTNIFYLVKSTAFFLFPLLIVAAAQLGYTLGDKNKRIFGFLHPAKKNSKK